MWLLASLKATAHSSLIELALDYLTPDVDIHYLILVYHRDNNKSSKDEKVPLFDMAFVSD